MGNKPVLGRLTANICIPSEKGLAPSEILRGFELDFVDLLRSESVEVTVIYKVLNWFVYSHFSYRRQNYYQIKKSLIKYSLWLHFFTNIDMKQYSQAMLWNSTPLTLECV